MSARLFKEDVLFFQRFLSCCGLYSDTLDGIYGEDTSRGEVEFDSLCDQIAAETGTSFDSRSEAKIRSLQVKVQPLARRSLKALLDSGRDARIISGTRSYAEQDALFRQGRFGNPGDKVTNARGGQSWHNFGLAWDIGLFEDGKYLEASGPYNSASSIAKIAGLEWGGDWSSFPDAPHYQWATNGQKVSHAREQFENGGRN